MRRTDRRQTGGFTLFEVLIALAVFMLAIAGIAKAIDTALQASLEVRQRTQCRQELETRLAYCLADPPKEGSPRIIPEENNNGVRIEEIVTAYSAKNAKGQELQGLKKLKILAKAGTQEDHAEILLNRP